MAKKDMNLGNIREKKKQLNDFYSSAGKLSSKQVDNLKKELSTNDRITLSNKEIEESIKKINSNYEDSVKNVEKLKVEQEAEYAIMQKKLGLSDDMMSLYKGINNYQKKLNDYQEKSIVSMRNMRKMNLSEIFSNPLKAMDNFSVGLMNKVIDGTKGTFEFLAKQSQELSGVFENITGDIEQMGNLGANSFNAMGQEIVGLQPAMQETGSSGNSMLEQIQTGALLVDTMGISQIQQGLAGTRGSMVATGATGTGMLAKLRGGFMALGGVAKTVGATILASLGSIAVVMAPILAIQAVVGGLIKMFELMNKFNFGGMAGEFGAAMAQIKQMWKIFEINIMETLEPLEPLFSSIFGGIADMMVGFVDVVTSVFGGFFDGLVSGLGGVKDMGGAFESMIGVVKPLLESIGSVLQPIFEVIGMITGVLMSALIPAFSVIGAIAIPIFEVIGGILKVISWSLGLVMDLMGKWNELTMQLFKPLIKIGEIIKDWIVDKWENFVTGIKLFGEMFETYVIDQWENFVTGIKLFGEMFKTYVIDQWESAIQKVKEFISLILGIELAKEKREEITSGISPTKQAEIERQKYITEREVNFVNRDVDELVGKEAKSTEKNSYNNVVNNKSNQITINNYVKDKKTAREATRNQNRQLNQSFNILAQRG